MTDLHYLSISQAGACLRSGEFSSICLTEHLLERIATLNERLNAFITVTGELAREQARRADGELAAGLDRGPLHGIPLAVKDLFATRNVRTTCGSLLFENHIPDADAAAVERLRQSGSVLLGKTGMYELAAGTTGANPHFGVVENPWQAGVDPGGSSSGSASAVAAGLAFGALGTDTGCSIRHPAHCCGIVGFKPTFGLVSKAGVQPLVWSMDHVGPLARSTQDAAILLNAIKGHDPNDSYSAKADLPSDTDLGPSSLKGIRIGIIRRYFFECETEIKSAIEAAIDTMSDTGATIVEVDLPDLEQAFEAIIETFLEASAHYEKEIEEQPENFSEAVLSKLRGRLTKNAVDYARAQHFRQGFRSRLQALFSDIDVLVAPTSRRMPAALDALPEGYELDVWKNTSIFNFTGHPSISIPCGLSADGLPIGLMMSGALHGDNRLLAIADGVEQTLSTNKLWPVPT